MNQETLHFRITVDGSGLKDIESKSTTAFNGIKKGVADLSKETVSTLQGVSAEVMQAVDKFNKLAKSVGINPSDLKQTLNFLREMRAEQERIEKAAMTKAERIANAEAKLIKQQIANLEAERRSREKSEKAELAAQAKLAEIKAQNIRYVNKLRDDEHAKMIRRIEAENKKIREQGNAAVAEFERILNIRNRQSLGGGFASGARNVFSNNNNGMFSNILGGMGGGGRFGGTIAAGLDGAMAAGGGLGGMLGGFAAGAGIGIAIAGFTELISLIKSAISHLYEWGKAGVQSAADFEMTVNAISVFAGSVARAKTELEELENMALNTPGLSLDGAEKGYKQLRALGFEAQNSMKLIEGLGKIKITSGATDQSVERVIVNLTQLSASTARAGQDIKEIIHAVPAMRQVFKDTFGTAEASKLKGLIEKDGNEFFVKLAEGMGKFKGASGGMNDALTKLKDQWTLVWREFGKPIVPVLTDAFQDLTKWLKANKNEFAEWGKVTANAIGWLISKTQKFLELYERLPGWSRTMTVQGVVGNVLKEQFKDSGLSATVQGLDSEAMARLEEEQAMMEERQDAMELAEEKFRQAVEKANKARLDELEDFYRLRGQIVSNAYKLEEERIGAALTYTTQQEIEKVNKIAAIRQKSAVEQMSIQVQSLDEQIALQKDDAEKVSKLNAKKAELINQFQTDIASNEINRMREVAEAERQIQEKRRAAAIDFQNQRIEVAKFGYDKIMAELSRSISRGEAETSSAYATMKAATEDYYDDLQQLVRDRYQLQLQDLTLTEDQKRNIIAAGNLEERNLAEQQKNALLKIYDDQLAAEESRHDKRLQRIKSLYSSLGTFIQSGVSSFFNPATFGSSSLEGFGNFFLQDERRKKLKGDVSQKQGLLNETLVDLKDKIGGKPSKWTTEELKTSIAYLSSSLKLAKDDLAEFEKSINPVYREIGKLGGELTKSADAFVNFDRIVALSLKERHRLETESMEAEMKNIQRRLQAERDRYVDNLIDKVNEAKRTLEKTKANKDPNTEIQAMFEKFDTEMLKYHRDKLAEVQKEGDKFLPPTDKAIELSGALEQLGLDLGNLGLKQHSEEADRYANSIEGLADRFNRLNSGDIGTINGVLNSVAKSVIQERIALLEENIELEARIGMVGDDSAARYRNAWLQAIYDVKRASEDARESQIRSQVEIANQTVFNAEVAKAGILESMAGAKGYTEIFQDAFLSVNQKIGDGISSVLHKATEGLGAFGDILADVASQLLQMVANRMMMKLLDMLLPTSGIGIGGGGSRGFDIGSIFSTVLGGLGIGGRGSNGAANVGAGAGMSFGAADAFASVSSITPSDTLSGAVKTASEAAKQITGSASGGMHEGLHKQILSGVGGAFNMGNLVKGIGAAAPMLGMSLGAGLGGQSVGGQLLGAAGGLAGGLLGGIATGALSAGTMLGGIFGTGGMLALGGLSAAMSATVVLAPLAAALMAGGWILGRNKQRRVDERSRTEYLKDAFGQLDDILAKVKSHDMGGAEAIAAAEQVREQYRQQASALKSKKTRNIALKEINDRINPKIEAIRAAAKIADEDKMRFEDRLPEFATGGIVPGRFGEPRLVLAHGGEIIANPSQQTPAFLAAASDAGVPGVKGKGSGGGSMPSQVNVEVFIGTEAQNQIFVNGAKSNKGYNVTIEQKKKATLFRDDA